MDMGGTGAPGEISLSGGFAVFWGAEVEPMPRKIPHVPLPAEATDAVYYCPSCKGKATFGKAYFAQLGEPDACPNCGAQWGEAVQHERIHRTVGDTDESMAHKRDALHKRRADRDPSKQRPSSPREQRAARMRELRDQLAALESAEADEDASETDAAPVVPLFGRELGEMRIKLGP